MQKEDFEDDADVIGISGSSVFRKSNLCYIIRPAPEGGNRLGRKAAEAVAVSVTGMRVSHGSATSTRVARSACALLPY